MTSTIERQLIEAFADARETVTANPDLFARVHRSIDEAAARRRWRGRMAARAAGFLIGFATLGVTLSFDHGRLTMKWWALELLTNVVLVGLAVFLGPFIKRFGRAYAADVFRANPRTGKSYLVLTDVAYYLIFTAFIMFTVTFEAPPDWIRETGAQLKDEVGRVGGILLIMGILHSLNVVALPVIGRLLSLNKKLDDGGPTTHHAAPPPGTPPLGPGTWILRVEPAPAAPPAPETLLGE